MAIETQIRCAIRDAVNRHSRKPFHWGGLAGYQQLEAIAQALHRVVDTSLETIYLRQLSEQVDRVLEKNQALVLDLQGAHHWPVARQPADGEPVQSPAPPPAAGERTQVDA